MIAAAILLALAPAAGDAKATVEAPSYFVAGSPFRVRLNLEAPADGATLQGGQLTQTAFTVDGKPLGEPSSGDPLQLKAGEKKTLEMDLAPLLHPTGDFELGWGAQKVKKVRVLEAAPAGEKYLDEAAMSAAELAKRWVLLTTNRGDILLEFWPDVAPGHVRNFLDLASSKFYDDVTFHRVKPGFMIQGGDPNGDGSGGGPRKLKAEFSDRKHVRGVLSAARRGTAGVPGPQDPLKDSASSQFFIMHAEYQSLDGNYSAFGQVVTGMDAVDKIVTTPTAGQDRPRTPQVIERAVVIRAPADPAAWRAQK